MSTTSGANVLRYSALCLGVFYGFYHQRSITQASRAAATQREYEHKQKLIDQAKAEYAKSKQPAAAATPAKAADSGDLGEYLEAWLGKA
ncbi:ATP synthase E chain-domain-containing protein [Cercophora newfieldiana]|uniref:ATP synthase F(0) complex subunit e, mitochondrial n=1 Tax=Cercophora newfieldiana TaxID=92897 RepID=A0AA39YSQ5_9PEZI|nr:ATP synthase E chain-domain-containing protein [Cercophora newfieldiana]